jgi:hypothetical protein
MTQHRCTCGYEAESPEDLTVHFGEMFTPADDVGPDGQVHAEAARDKRSTSGTQAPATLTCRCGLTTSFDGFDQHLTDVFTPADRIGLDGKKHQPA